MPKATVTGGGSDYTEGTPDDAELEEVKPEPKKAPAPRKTTAAAKKAAADDKTE